MAKASWLCVAARGEAAIGASQRAAVRWRTDPIRSDLCAICRAGARPVWAADARPIRAGRQRPHGRHATAVHSSLPPARPGRLRPVPVGSTNHRLSRVVDSSEPPPPSSAPKTTESGPRLPFGSFQVGAAWLVEPPTRFINLAYAGASHERHSADVARHSSSMFLRIVSIPSGWRATGLAIWDWADLASIAQQRAAVTVSVESLADLLSTDKARCSVAPPPVSGLRLARLGCGCLFGCDGQTHSADHRRSARPDGVRAARFGAPLAPLLP